ncbi:hypothetical protein ANN_28037 [Periplaneta americana]|uniref:DUF7869 domain-containing protein n=1 Tax=Periplaneta americana TaxID=6978 RepID=A0ABQ8RUT5_PERAM|nr:hypothetical protein ANN_28037 [Periplaneta americana]
MLQEGLCYAFHSTKMKLFDEFYVFYYNGQSQFLYKCIQIMDPVKRRGNNSDETSRRKCTFRYFTTVDHKQIEVCMKTLCDIFSVTARRLQVLQGKMKEGIQIPTDKRGKHTNRPHAVSDQLRDMIKVQSELHHCKAEAAYGMLKRDTDLAKTNENVIVSCKDLQQVLSCPTLKHSSVYYQRQLSCYNLAIHNMGKGEATMYLWYECLAKRGSAEVASCMLNYIIDTFEVLSPNQERKLIVWSDRCIGQNNNWRMIALYRYLIHTGYFSQIEQKFLVSGHSFCPATEILSYRKKKRTADVMVPGEWKYVIGEACVLRPFTVREMYQADF